MLRLPFNWPTYVLLLALAVSCAGLWWTPTAHATIADGVFVLLTVGSALMSVSAFACLCAYCRCRYCGYKLFWHAVGERDKSDSMGWFFTARECPKCGRARDGAVSPSTAP